MQSQLDHGIDYVWCCDIRADGGFMPQPLDTVPTGQNPALRDIGQTRHMKLGPKKNKDIAPDTVPHGGAGTAKKLLYNRTDPPWTGTSKGKEFGQFPYFNQNPENVGKDKSPNKNKGPAQRGLRASSMRPSMRLGAISYPYSSFPHVADPPKKQGPPLKGSNLKTGRAPELFDKNPYSGPQMVGNIPLEGADKMNYLSQIKNLPKRSNSVNRKDTFNSFPEHIADPFSDNPLGDMRGKNASNRPFAFTCAPTVKASMPIVNVWDAPAGLQTKAGVKISNNLGTGERAIYLSDKGRLGTTQ